MRYRIIKQTYGDDTFDYHIKEKGLIFWTKRCVHFPLHTPRVICYPTLEDALEEVKSLIHAKMSETVVDVQVVYDTKGK